MNPPRVRWSSLAASLTALTTRTTALSARTTALTALTAVLGCSQRPSSGDAVDDAFPAPPALVEHGTPAYTPESTPEPQPPPGSRACPDEMVEVVGNYCPDVRHTCLAWMDPPGAYELFRCARYGKPVCATPATERKSLRFCIDRDEYTAPGDSLPSAHHSWTTAKQTCESLGKRLCLESEWQSACEGEEMRPYPYGFVRDAAACNIDRSNLGKPNAGLRDLREPAGSHPLCVSPFGVRDMSGNVEEWATLDQAGVSELGKIDRSTMKGAWWLPGRNHCRAATTGHGETYEGGQVGVRCCRDFSVRP